jgi:hypothetical protein
MHAIPSRNVLECTQNCQNGGTCIILANSSSGTGSTTNTNASSSTVFHNRNTLSQRCACPPGYGGLFCEYHFSAPCFVRFDTEFYCQAESPCVPSRAGGDNHDSHFCDCRHANPKSAFAGLDCDYSATEYCTDGESVSRIAFCTNGGSCVTYMDDDNVDDHPGCNCPLGYTGRHCEFLDGMVPTLEEITSIVIDDDILDDHPGCNCPLGYTGRHCEYADGIVPTMEESTAPKSVITGDGLRASAILVMSMIIMGLLSFAYFIRRWWCVTKHFSLDHDLNYEYGNIGREEI